MIAGRLPLRAIPEQAIWHYCEDHAALVGLRGTCPGPAFDFGLACRSVTVQAAFSFGDWPPRGPVNDSATQVIMARLFATTFGGDR